MGVLQFPQQNPERKGIPADYSQLPIGNNRLAREHESPEAYDQRVSAANSMAEQVFFSQGIVRCLKGKHFPGKVVFSCDHCATQDPVHPDGMVWSPFKYFLCMTCYKRHMLRKFELNLALKAYCYQCILDEVERIKTINPTLYKDFAKDGVK